MSPHNELQTTREAFNRSGPSGTLHFRFRAPAAAVWFPKLFVLVISFASCAMRAERFVEITAEIDTVTYTPGEAAHGPSQVHREYSVVCTTGTNEWRIDNNFVQGAEEHWYFDGTNVYDAIHPLVAPTKEASDRARKGGLAPVPFDVAKLNLTIHVFRSPDGLPMGNCGVNIPWLAFCSGSYLRRAVRTVPIPVATLRHTPDGFAYSDKTESFQDELGLPRTIDLLTSASLYEASIRRFNEENALGDRPLTPSAVADGMLKFHYVVTATTNFADCSIPLAFEYVQYDLASGKVRTPRYGGSGRVTSVRATAKPQGVFDPSLQQTIVDWRFRDERKQLNALSYVSTNTFALPPDDPTLKARFAARVARAPLPAAIKQRRIRIASALLLCLAVAFPLALRARRTYQANHKRIV